MATTIDELVVTLGLDPTEFSEGQKKALDDFKKTQESAKKTADQMEQDGKQAGRFYSNIRNEALATIAVLVGAKDVAQFVGQTVTNLSAVGRIAQVMGQATPDVLAVSMAVERIGGNAQEAQQSMLGLSQALERYSRFGEGSLEFKRGLGMIGAGPSDTPLQVLQKFAAWSQGKKPQDVELIGQQIGLNQDLINLTIQGRKGFDSAIAQSYRNGIPTDADIKKIQNLQKAFFDLAQSLKYAGTELVVDVADPISHLMEMVAGLIHDFPTATKIILALVAALTALKGIGLSMGVARALAGGGAAGGGGAAAAEAAAGGGAVAGGGGLLAGGGIAAGAAVAAGAVALLWPSDLGTDDDVWRPVIENMKNQPTSRLIAAVKFFNGRLASNVSGPHARDYINILHALTAELNSRSGHVDASTAAAGGGAGGPPPGRRSLNVRNNNPGNLIDPATGRFRHFATWDEGAAAMKAQIVRDFRVHGLHTIAELINDPKWGWSPENAPGNTHAGTMNYIAAVSKALGVGSNQNVNLADPGVLSKLVDAMSAFEGGWRYRGRSRGMQTADASSVHIDNLNVYSQAKDAGGIARDVKRELAQQLATNANGALV